MLVPCCPMGRLSEKCFAIISGELIFPVLLRMIDTLPHHIPTTSAKSNMGGLAPPFIFGDWLDRAVCKAAAYRFLRTWRFRWAGG